jgi:predicted anti-sigma-YlaC factor YlaD
MMTCRQLIDFIQSYLEGELPPLRAAAFTFHLMLCHDCRNYLETYQRTIEMSRLAMTPNEPVPSDVPSGLIYAIRKSMSK